jgi:hypothetical protein
MTASAERLHPHTLTNASSADVAAQRTKVVRMPIAWIETKCEGELLKKMHQLSSRLKKKLRWAEDRTLRNVADEAIN